MPPNYEDGRPQVAHLVMLGTPNMGSPCADVMDTAFGVLGKNVEAVRQLRQDVAAEFNRVYLNRKGVKFSALAGNPLLTMCKNVVWNDGVVSVPSAKWQIADNAESKSLHTDLTGTKDFSDFVKPRLAIGPKGNHNPAPPSTASGSMAAAEQPAPLASGGAVAQLLPGGDAVGGVFPRLYGARDITAAIFGAPLPDETPRPFAKAQTIAPKQAVEIEIPVQAAQDLGITFMASPSISATLVDDKGGIAGKNLAGTPESKGVFRSIYVSKPVTAGIWKLRVENTGTMDLEIVLTTWANAVKP